MNKRILFVDDEPKILEGISRMLRGIRFECEMRFASGGPDALELLAREPFDLVVSDMRMPEMNGLQFLAEVKARHPNVIRMMLSGYAEPQLLMQSVGLAHQFLSKPCEADSLRATVLRALELRNLLGNDAIKRLVSRMSVLPSLPSLYFEIVSELQSTEPSIHRVGDIISKDPGMTAKMLQLVNSAFFGIRRVVSNPREAAAFLGLDTIHTLVLSLHAFRQFETGHAAGFSIGHIWNHSMATGLLAKRIMESENPLKGQAAEAFTAGLLHDLGKLVLAANLPREYAEVFHRKQNGECSLQDAEHEAFGSTHAEIGAYLLGLWGLPSPIVAAVALHHRPGDSSDAAFGPLCAVHVANSLESAPEDGNAEHEDAALLDISYLEQLGKTCRMDIWQRWCARSESKGTVQ